MWQASRGQWRVRIHTIGWEHRYTPVHAVPGRESEYVLVDNHVVGPSEDIAAVDRLRLQYVWTMCSALVPTIPEVVDWVESSWLPWTLNANQRATAGCIGTQYGWPFVADPAMVGLTPNELPQNTTKTSPNIASSAPGLDGNDFFRREALQVRILPCLPLCITRMQHVSIAASWLVVWPLLKLKQTTILPGLHVLGRASAPSHPSTCRKGRSEEPCCLDSLGCVWLRPFVPFQSLQSWIAKTTLHDA
jgi:hypothetical protein